MAKKTSAQTLTDATTMTPTQRRRFFERLAAADPHPSTELEYGTPFELLVAVVLSAQATDKSVNKATPQLFKAANTPKKMLALGEEGLIPYIQTIGLFRSKARHIIGLCEQLLRDHHGEVPSSREALEKLPGVGRKTANVVLNVAFGKSTIAVDTHIFRVSNRTGLAAGKNVLEVEQALLKNVPSAFLQHAHHWLILHGRYVCTARRPRCEVCVVSDLCAYPEKSVERSDG